MKKYIFAACAFALLFGFYKAEANDLLKDIESMQPATLSLSQSALDEMGATMVKASLPKAGESFKGGDTIKVKWNPSQLKTEEVAILISYFQKKGDDMPTLSDYMTYGIENSGSYEYELPSEMPSGYYRIYMASNDTDIRILAESGMFNITSGIRLDGAILKSLEDAQAKGSNAAAKSHLSGVRAEAELYYDSNGNSYKDLCKKGNDGIYESVTNAGLSVKAKADCDSNEKQWAAEVKLLLKEGYFCVDSTGSGKVQKKSKGKSAVSCVKGKAKAATGTIQIQKLIGLKKSYSENTEAIEFSAKVIIGKNKVVNDDVYVYAELSNVDSGLRESFSIATYDAKSKAWKFKLITPREPGTYKLDVVSACNSYGKFCTDETALLEAEKTMTVKITEAGSGY